MGGLPWQDFGWGGLEDPDRRPRVRSSEDFARPAPSMTSGADQRVSIQTTSATSPTRDQDTAGSGLCDQRGFGRAIFMARRREARVVGLIPRRSAAPPWP